MRKKNPKAMIQVNKIRKQLAEEDETEHFRALEQTGFYGARGSGCVLMSRNTGRMLLVLRSGNVEEPYTWGNIGGAHNPNEDPLASASREIQEETEYLGDVEMIPLYTFIKGSFVYQNYLGLIDEEFVPHLNWEATTYKWVELDNWPQPLHFGIKALFNDPESYGTLKKFYQHFSSAKSMLQSVKKRVDDEGKSSTVFPWIDEITKLATLLQSNIACSYKEPYMYRGAENSTEIATDENGIVTHSESKGLVRKIKPKHAWRYRLMDLLYNYTNSGFYKMNEVFYAKESKKTKKATFTKHDRLKAVALYHFIQYVSSIALETKLFPKRQQVYRGVFIEGKQLKRVQAYRVGKTFIFPAFTSTSTEEEIAANFHRVFSEDDADEYLNVMYYLTLRRGTPRLDLSTSEELGNEKEVILAPKCEFRIDKLYRDDDEDTDANERVLEVYATFVSSEEIDDVKGELLQSLCELKTYEN
jgi:8-oxo-dGTP pyrophosphatase MutT (NUDIX family)